jgi:Domain of unknown function (DUF5659)
VANEDFRSKDLGQAAYLVASGFRLMKTEGGSEKVFVFSPEARAVADSYFSGARVIAKDFANALRTVKALLYPRD